MTTWRAARWAVVAVFFCVAAARPSIAQDAPAAAETRGETRTWTDISGKFSREAEFLELAEGKVRLRLSSGKEIAIPLKELSKKDRDWVRANGAPKGAGGAKGVATRIVLRSYQALVADSVILSQSLEQQALAGAIPGFFVALTGGKPLEGFDVKRPIVVTIHVDGRGQHSGTMVAVPVTAKETFQKTLDAVFPAKTTPKGRAYEVAMLGKSVYAKPGEKVFLLSDSAEIVRAAQADPEDPVAVADVTMESMIAAVPEEIRLQGLAQWEALMTNLPVDPAAPAARVRSQQVTSEWMRKAVRSIVTEGDRSTFEASVDPTTKRVSLSVGIRARAGTALAESFAAYGALRPRFVASQSPDALGWVGISLPTGEWLRMFLEESLKGGIAGMHSAMAGGEVPPAVRELVAEVERQSRTLMEADHVEQETVFTSDGSGSPRVLARLAIDGIQDFHAALVKLVTSDPNVSLAPDADGILSLPVPPSEAFLPGPGGSQPVRLAATKGAMIVGVGLPDSAPVKAMLAATPAGSASSPISARVDLSKLWPMIAATNEATAALAGVVGESGMLSADVNALADGIEMRLNVDEGVLKLLGAAGSAFAAAQAQAGGFPGAPGGAGAPPGFPPAGGPGSPAAGGVPKRRLGVAPAEGGPAPTIQGFPTPPIPQPNQPEAPAP